jgi:hypothetical protein
MRKQLIKTYFVYFSINKKIKVMKVFLKLGAKIDECKRHVFNQGYSYGEAHNYVKLVFEETGLKFGVFDYVEKEEIENVIEHLSNKILKQ